jgi:hypothetical protein
MLGNRGINYLYKTIVEYINVELLHAPNRGIKYFIKVIVNILIYTGLHAWVIEGLFM